MRDDDLLKVFRTVVPAFNAEYPDVEVNLKGVDIATKLPPALVSGAGPPDGSFWEDDQIGRRLDDAAAVGALGGGDRDAVARGTGGAADAQQRGRRPEQHRVEAHHADRVALPADQPARHQVGAVVELPDRVLQT
ncbi:extracellular solute-binding protein [Nonomuraea pusilla]|nr:extracellular solute-binding protein [Nonomuraea pusilla]